MTAFNVVRFRVKPGQDQAFLDAHREFKTGFPGARRINVVKTGERSYCLIGEWESMKHLVDARPQMIGRLDQVRPLLEDLGGDLGLTDPVSGESLIEHLL